MKPQTLVGQHLTEIAIFDSRLDDLSTLLTGLNPGVEPLVLHPDEDALVQIAAVLANRQNIQALHLIGHGAPGMVFLGRSPITRNDLTATQLQPWKDALAANASILIYGCNVAAGEHGQAFITQLQHLTQAHIAASTTPIGHAAYGGNWELDAMSFPHAVRLAIQPAARAAYAGILIAPDDLSTDLFNLNGSAAIANEGGTDIIRLTPDETFQRGTALSNSKIDLTTDWTLSFELAFGNADEGADGIAFILHNDPAGVSAVGTDGGGLGVGGIQNALAIEFDTLANGDLNDPGFDHTAIFDPEEYGTANPAVITGPTQLGVDANNNPLNIETGQYYLVSISWNAETNTLTYSFDGNEFAPLTRDLITTDFNGATEVFWGFGGGTGAETNPHSVRFLAGDDSLTGTEERDVLFAGAGDDAVLGLGGNDRLAGEDGDDRLFGGDGNDRLIGNDGNDNLVGGPGNDRILGGEGNDRIAGNAGDDRLVGGNGDDTLLGGAGDDTLIGGADDDRLLGAGGDDLMRGNLGDDILNGGAGADRQFGGAGDDRLNGQGSDDVLRGGAGNDVLRGGVGNDRLLGEAGNDRIITGDGVDRIVVRRNQGRDIVTDFTDGQDLIVLGGIQFGQLTFQQSGNDVRVSLGSDDLLVLQNLTVGQLSQADFV